MGARASPSAVTSAEILVVDDDAHLREVVGYALRREGFRVIEAADGEQAERTLSSQAIDLVVLDVGMPHLDGFELCRRLRPTSRVPILFLSSRTDELDRVLGLELGGDDYVVKPFGTRELVSRIRAILRRSHREEISAPTRVHHGRLALAPEEHRAWVGEVEVELTATEFRLLAVFAGRPQRVFTRTELAAAAYPDARRVCDRTVDSHVRRIRSKLRYADFDPIETVHGVGYRMGDGD
jgi:two-component system, OmpR family, response regulator